uniref:Ig-like domain-containing protein n=1 Tax=Salarias fasciatus TaxID=181472 RepID=A0A672I9Y0_SALFA
SSLQDQVFVLCLAQRGFPSDWTLHWEVDGFQVSGGSGGLEEVSGPGTLMGDGLYTWTSTLKIPAVHWRKTVSVTCQASQGSQTPVRQTLRREQCQQP